MTAPGFEWLQRQIFHFGGIDLTLGKLILFAICLLIGFGLSAVLQSGKTTEALHRIGLDQGFFAFARFVLSLALVVGFILLGVNVVGVAIPWDQKITALNLSLVQMFRLIFVLLLVLWLSSFLKHRLIVRVLNRSGLDPSLRYAIAQVTSYTIILIGLLMALQNTGVDLSTLTVFAGALGVGIGLGLQNISSNFISGLILLAERPIKIGDRIEVNKVAGQVVNIQARSTTVLTNDNITLIVPNSAFTEHTITNWSHGDQKVRFRIPVSVAYGTDLDLVREALLEVARGHPRALSEPEPTVFFEAFGDSALNLELVVWSAEMSYRPRRFRSDLNFAIDKALRARGIEVPFPQRELRWRTAAPVESEGSHQAVLGKSSRKT